MKPASAAAERLHASFRLTRYVTPSGRCQIRGGQKGGLPVCDKNGLLANETVISAKAGGKTMTADVPMKLKHFAAQVATAPQSTMPFSHGVASGGQQSGMSAVTDAGSSD